MIKRIVPIALAIGLGSCSGMSSQQLSLIDEIEQGAITACGYAPSVVSITALLGGLVPGVSSAGPIITEICAEVNKLKTTPAAAAARVGKSAVVVVRGVAVQGVYTR